MNLFLYLLFFIGALFAEHLDYKALMVFWAVSSAIYCYKWVEE